MYMYKDDEQDRAAREGANRISPGPGKRDHNDFPNLSKAMSPSCFKLSAAPIVPWRAPGHYISDLYRSMQEGASR